MKIAFILHGKYAHKHKAMADIKASFAEGFDISCQTTACAGQFTPLTANAVNNGATHIICVGGDGSLNETVNGLMQAAGGKPANIKLGLLPAGTGNDFARSMGVSYDISLLKECILKDKCKAVDVGIAAIKTAGGQTLNRYFINIMDIGIGGYISQKISGSSKPLGPFITYQWAIINALLRYKNQPVNIKADTFNHSGRIMSFIMANGKYFGGGLGISPEADLHDGQFSTVIIGDISMLDYLKNQARVRRCEKLTHPELKYINASQIEIDSPGSPLPVDMDGEFAGFTPLQLNILPGAVNFICP
jgi:diacylglycerol kinase (ATP)